MEISFGNSIVCSQTSECANTVITCNPNENCDITCDGTSSCFNSTINCPANYECSVSCSRNNACQHSIFNGFLSSKLILPGCVTGSYTCCGITVYCPIHTITSEGTVNKNCIISGDNSLSGAINRGQGVETSDPLNFYSVYGWKDIDMSGYTGDFTYQLGTMHCSLNYNISCDFASNDWTCVNSMDCNNDIITPTLINTIWNDNYQYTPYNGWILKNENMNHNQGGLLTSHLIGSDRTYHGAFTGDNVGTTIDIFSLLQYFYCPYDSSVDITYFFGFSCSEPGDYLSVYINNTIQQTNTADKDQANITAFQDVSLESQVASFCPDSWQSFPSIKIRIPFINANVIFGLKYEIGVNLDNDALTISELNITCKLQTQSPTTFNPTNQPITTSPTTLQPITNEPITNAPSTIQPTYQPTTITPTTFSPTNQPITSMPTRTRAPTQEPTIEPTIEPTLNPSYHPTGEPTNYIVTNTNSTFQNTQSNDISVESVETINGGKAEIEGIIAAFVIIIICFIFVVIIACILYRKHENTYGTIYKQRTEQITKNLQNKSKRVSTNYGVNDNQHFAETAIQLTTTDYNHEDSY